MISGFLGNNHNIRGEKIVKYPFGNNPAKIEKYKGFWNRDETDRPLVGFTFRGFFPLEEYKITKAWERGTLLTPDMIKPAEFMEDEEKSIKEGEVIDDDIIRGNSPIAAAVPWLSGILGSELVILPGNVLGKEQVLDWDKLEDVKLDYKSPWFKKYIEYAKTLVKRANGHFPVSHGAFRGPSDLLGLLRGTTQSIIDLYVEPKKVKELLWKLTNIFIEITEEIWKEIPLFEEGYFDGMYQLWAPGSIVRLQEDASALYSPKLYRKFLQPLDRKIAEYFDNCFIHLHSTSMFLLDAFLEIEEIRCFEINNDEGGPAIKDMIPYFKMVQKAERPLLIRGSFSQSDIKQLMDLLDPRGLYLLIMVKDLEEVNTLKLIVGI